MKLWLQLKLDAHSLKSNTWPWFLTTFYVQTYVKAEWNMKKRCDTCANIIFFNRWGTIVAVWFVCLNLISSKSPLILAAKQVPVTAHYVVFRFVPDKKVYDQFKNLNYLDCNRNSNIHNLHRIILGYSTIVSLESVRAWNQAYVAYLYTYTHIHEFYNYWWASTFYR